MKWIYSEYYFKISQVLGYKAKTDEEEEQEAGQMSEKTDAHNWSMHASADYL